MPDIRSETFTLKKLFQSAIYNIDYYQREYAWSDEDVRVLVTDLRQEFSKIWQHGALQPARFIEPYFLGPFVYYDEKRELRFLVDGQQRFTTLHLIFVHLHAMARDYQDRKAVDKLARAIMEYDSDRERFRIDIEERNEALRALFEGYDYELPRNASLSLRNLWQRSAEIAELLDEFIDSETCGPFVEWLLNHVVMVGIQAVSRDNGFKIFESMNDRGAQLTQVDLVKSFLLSNVGSRNEDLNKRWRDMLAELTRVRGDRDAPRKFLAAALISRWANVAEEEADDQHAIERAVNVWLRKPANRDRVGLRRPGQDYFIFVENLIALSVHYANLMRATTRPFEVNGLAAVYFNAVNGIGSQMSLILATLRPKDTPTDANAKAALVANYLDRWYTLRALDYQSVDTDSVDREVRRLIPLLRQCTTQEDVARALSGQMERDSFSAVFGYRMQGNNKAQVRYFVSRLTSYVQRGTAKPDLIEEYLGSERKWQIEHLWPDHPEWYAKDVPDPGVYRALRSRVGVLALLPRRDNNSLNDMPLANKIDLYGRQNGLIAILEANYRRRHPDLQDFIKDNEIEKYFRGFPTNARMEPMVDSRAELYRRLAARIWDPERLGFTLPGAIDELQQDNAATTASDSSAKPVRKRLLQTDVAKMVRAGVLLPGTRLIGHYSGVEYNGTVNDLGQIVLPSGDGYDKPDDAARTATGKRQDAMSFWCLADTKASLRELKQQAVGDGTLPGSRQRRQ